MVEAIVLSFTFFYSDQIMADFNCGPTQNALLYTVVPDLCFQKLTKISWNCQIDEFFWSQMFSLVTLIAKFYVKTSYQSFQNYIDLTKFFVKSPDIRRQSYQNLTEKVKNVVNLAFSPNVCLFSKNGTLLTLSSE